MYEKKGQVCPFILYPRQNIEDIHQCVLENYGRIKYELPFINALCVEIPEEKVQTIKTNRRVAMMSEDIQVSKLTGFGSDKSGSSARFIKSTEYDRYAESAAPVASAQMFGRFPFQTAPDMKSKGKGVSIAVIDTGVAIHYDLIRPLNRIRMFRDFVNGKTQPYDDDGHGTHVAGIALGNGYASGAGGHEVHRGTAPCADLVALKALDQEGNGNASNILAAMQWIYDHHKRYHIKVVNLSLGIRPSGRSQIDPLTLGANELVHAGLCVVAAAGNSGPEQQTITSPGISPLVITVGSCDGRDHIPDFSSRGPTPAGQVKPDVVAPGVDIVSLSARSPKEYVAQSGTSMSAPYVAGLAACYCAQHPAAHPFDVKKALLCAAAPIEQVDRNAQGYGLL